MGNPVKRALSTFQSCGKLPYKSDVPVVYHKWYRIGRKDEKTVQNAKKDDGFYEIPAQIESILDVIRNAAETILDEVVPLQVVMQSAKDRANMKTETPG